MSRSNGLNLDIVNEIGRGFRDDRLCFRARARD